LTFGADFGERSEIDEECFEWLAVKDGASFSSAEYCSETWRIRLKSPDDLCAEYCAETRRIRLKSSDDSSFSSDFTGDGASGDDREEALLRPASRFGVRVLGFFIGVEKRGLEISLGRSRTGELDKDFCELFEFVGENLLEISFLMYEFAYPKGSVLLVEYRRLPVDTSS